MTRKYHNGVENHLQRLRYWYPTEAYAGSWSGVQLVNDLTITLGHGRCLMNMGFAILCELFSSWVITDGLLQ